MKDIYKKEFEKAKTELIVVIILAIFVSGIATGMILMTFIKNNIAKVQAEYAYVGK